MDGQQLRWRSTRTISDGQRKISEKTNRAERPMDMGKKHVNKKDIDRNQKGKSTIGMGLH